MKYSKKKANDAKIIYNILHRTIFFLNKKKHTDRTESRKEKQREMMILGTHRHIVVVVLRRTWVIRLTFCRGLTGASGRWCSARGTSRSVCHALRPSDPACGCWNNTTGENPSQTLALYTHLDPVVDPRRGEDQGDPWEGLPKSLDPLLSPV